VIADSAETELVGGTSSTLLHAPSESAVSTASDLNRIGFNVEELSIRMAV
jgi:hypothetical protein